MAKLLIFIALCVLPVLVSARREPTAGTFFIARGRVFCDTCRCGFETTKTTYIHGAKVRVECIDRKSGEMVYTAAGATDETGTYNIPISGDHGDEICEAVLVKSPQSECAMIAPGRHRARVFPTNSNGIATNLRYANNLGFIKDAPVAGCAELLKLYKESDD